MSLPDPSSNSYVAVTGAASGIGAALAHELARLGHDVLAIDVDANGSKPSGPRSLTDMERGSTPMHVTSPSLGNAAR